MLEAGTVLAAVAACTSRIGVGPLVLSNTFRHPAVLANMAASLDHVAAGRFTLGLGAGWLQAEHDGYGLPFGTTRERIERLDKLSRSSGGSTPSPAPSSPAASTVSRTRSANPSHSGAGVCPS